MDDVGLSCLLAVPDLLGLDVGLVSTDSFPCVVAVGSMMSELSSESIVCMILLYQSMLVFCCQNELFLEHLNRLAKHWNESGFP